mmetsp:Transcript_4569/g.10753  ORF Transcript_4569/g.10753 Transcript_4569/m.10753 type:complete len:319 (+) Transcript_4569:1173-2129(+)
MAASFMRASSEAPENPGVRRAMEERSTPSARGFPRAWTLRMAMRPLKSGRPTCTRRSKRPGRRRAGSRTSARLVAARTMTPVFPSKPSIWVRIWFRVCSRSSFPPAIPVPRCRPMASISSMKMMQGAFFLAMSKRSRTREAPTPTKSSTNSEPADETNGTPASPAVARARRVLPVPGGPSMITPFGTLAPSLVNFSGFFRNSTISMSSCLASSLPATWSKTTPVLGCISILDRVRPNWVGLTPPKGPPPPPPPWPPPWLPRDRKNPMMVKMMIGTTIDPAKLRRGFDWEFWAGRMATSTLCSRRILKRSSVTGTLARR